MESKLGQVRDFGTAPTCSSMRLRTTQLKAEHEAGGNLATSLGKEIIEIMSEYQLKREDRVLPETHTTQPRRQIFELACEHFRDGREGKG